MAFDETSELFCAELLKHSDPQTKVILDIGCGDGNFVKFIAKNYSPKYVIGIDSPTFTSNYGTNEEEGKNWRIEHGDACYLNFEDDTFDLVVSFSTFEHIANIRKTLSEVKRVLKPFGRFYIEFMPLWTSAAGHHFIKKGTCEWNPEHLKLIPPWGHLYMPSGEMRGHLLSRGIESELAEEMIDSIYFSDAINRCSRSAMACDIMASEMLVRHYEERVSFNRLGMILGERHSELTTDIVEKIRRTNIRVDDLGVVGLRVCLEKFANM